VALSAFASMGRLSSAISCLNKSLSRLISGCQASPYTIWHCFLLIYKCFGNLRYFDYITVVNIRMFKNKYLVPSINMVNTIANSIDKVVLINTVAGKGVIDEGKQSSSLRLIQEALKESGYETVLLYPANPISSVSAVFGGLNRMVDDLEAKLKNEWNIVFGFSVYTGTYWVFQEIAKLIKKKFPFSTIVAGGPHFARESIFDSDGVRCLDSVEVALSETHEERQITDFVVVGDAQPFIDFINSWCFNAPGSG